jgi:hypothetical protein
MPNRFLEEQLEFNETHIQSAASQANNLSLSKEERVYALREFMRSIAIEYELISLIKKYEGNDQIAPHTTDKV